MPPVRPRQPKHRASANRSQKLRSDAILPIKPEFVKLILERKKNHEYRKYKLGDVKRFWLYETSPRKKIVYVMTTTYPKIPGEVQDPQGIGNDDFDAGKKVSKYGYPVLHLHRLKTPLSLKQMREYGIHTPQSFVYLPIKLAEAFPLDEMEEIF